MLTRAIILSALLVAAHSAQAQDMTCTDAMRDLGSAMQSVGLYAPQMHSAIDPALPTTTDVTGLLSMYKTAALFQEKGQEDVCLQIVDEARARLDDMIETGYLKVASAPLLAGACRANTLLDMTVMTPGRERVGRIEDVVLDVKEGRIQYAVLSTGGLLTERLYPIPWEAFAVAEDGRSLELDINTDALDAAPGFDRSVWPDLKSPEWSKRVQDFYASLTP